MEEGFASIFVLGLSCGLLVGLCAFLVARTMRRAFGLVGRGLLMR